MESQSCCASSFASISKILGEKDEKLISDEATLLYVQQEFNKMKENITNLINEYKKLKAETELSEQQLSTVDLSIQQSRQSLQLKYFTHSALKEDRDKIKSEVEKQANLYALTLNKYRNEAKQIRKMREEYSSEAGEIKKLRVENLRLTVESNIFKKKNINKVKQFKFLCKTKSKIFYSNITILARGVLNFHKEKKLKQNLHEITFNFDSLCKEKSNLKTLAVRKDQEERQNQIKVIPREMPSSQQSGSRLPSNIPNAFESKISPLFELLCQESQNDLLFKVRARCDQRHQEWLRQNSDMLKNSPISLKEKKRNYDIATVNTMKQLKTVIHKKTTPLELKRASKVNIISIHDIRNNKDHENQSFPAAISANTTNTISSLVPARQEKPLEIEDFRNSILNQQIPPTQEIPSMKMQQSPTFLQDKMQFQNRHFRDSYKMALQTQLSAPHHTTKKQTQLTMSAPDNWQNDQTLENALSQIEGAAKSNHMQSNVNRSKSGTVKSLMFTQNQPTMHGLKNWQIEQTPQNTLSNIEDAKHNYNQTNINKSKSGLFSGLKFSQAQCAISGLNNWQNYQTSQNILSQIEDVEPNHIQQNIDQSKSGTFTSQNSQNLSQPSQQVSAINKTSYETMNTARSFFQQPGPSNQLNNEFHENIVSPPIMSSKKGPFESEESEYGSIFDGEELSPPISMDGDEPEMSKSFQFQDQGITKMFNFSTNNNTQFKMF